MAFIIFKMLYICSECKTVLKVEPSEHLPEVCPACNVEFDMTTVHDEDVVTHEFDIGGEG